VWDISLWAFGRVHHVAYANKWQVVTCQQGRVVTPAGQIMPAGQGGNMERSCSELPNVSPTGWALAHVRTNLDIYVKLHSV
jgi:hypothetical protein